MRQIISEKAADKLLTRYFNMLDATGYVKKGTVTRYAIYLFILDMVKYMHTFIDEKDYNTIERALGKLFTGAGCLLPYPVFCTRCATMGLTDFMGGVMTERVTEDDQERITEDGTLRTY